MKPHVHGDSGVHGNAVGSFPSCDRAGRRELDVTARDETGDYAAGG
ncbi:Hypothetical protein A7982_10780 [Minicystis rosea]|nr:Hypothetical protein A7982_10780 [Minicystis rosea]